ncbi:MAG TPA: phosphoheptose isomerase [Bacteroidetes bacterium]|nr:phosphoheptose isomerase [Bacteroidota bacterium]
MYTFLASVPQKEVFETLASTIAEMGFTVVGKDENRPWGGFFVIEEAEAPLFIEVFFPHLSLKDFEGFEKLSPKILVVAPEKRLSWQYHHRRAEIWKVVGGVAGVVVSNTDEETPLRKLQMGEVVELQQGERHRLIGLEMWGIIAEIWQHTDRENPSDEADIVRVQDDFGR